MTGFLLGRASVRGDFSWEYVSQALTANKYVIFLYLLYYLLTKQYCCVTRQSNLDRNVEKIIITAETVMPIK